MLRMDAVRRELRGILIALVLVAATTLVAFLLIRYLDVRRGSVIFLLPVLLAGWHLGLIPALVAAVAGVLWSGYFFFSPYYSYYLARPNEILNLALFMVVAVVTSHLANSMKRQTEIARKRENEVSDLYTFSRRLAAAHSADEIYTAIEEHLASLVRRKVVLFGAAGGRAGRTGRVTPDERAVPERVRAEVAQAHSTLGTTVDDGTGNIWLVRRVSQKTADFGVIAIDLGSVPADAVADVRLRVDDVLSDAAATLERLDVARALNDAKMRSETDLLREALIGSVSHELRTPLASILGAGDGADPVAGDRQGRAADVARQRGARRGRAPQQRHPEPARCHPHQPPADQAAAGMDRAAGHRQFGARPPPPAAGRPPCLRSTWTPICRSIYVDPVLVEQAFVQIVDNAAKYSPAGSPITVAAKRNGHDVVLSVHDKRHGAHRRGKAQLGERFFRGARHAAATSGSGLGLWIAKAFVGANGGKIEAMSSGADQGSTVSIHLPFATPASQPEVGPDD